MQVTLQYTKADMKRVVVLGAGITGIVAAYYLAKEGYKVTVVEQEPYPAMRTSYANGGQVSVSNSEVWTTWSNVRKGFKWMLQKDAPLLVRPTPEIAKIKWIAKFLWHTITNSYETNTKETIRLGLESRDLYKKIIQDEGLEFDQSFCGILHIYKDLKYLDSADAAQYIYKSSGCEWEMISPAEILKIDPSLASIDQVVGGAWTPSDWTGDIHKFCQELKKVLEQKYNVKFHFDTKIDKLVLKELTNTYNNIIVSAGIGSIKIAKMLGDTLPVYPVKGYSITITVPENQMKYIPKVSLLDDQAKIVTSTLGNRFRVAGTAELTGENYDIRRDRVGPLLKWVRKNFPNLDISNYSSWACLRPMTPNMMPIVEQSNTRGVYYHTGHGHLGWTLSPATAKQLVEMVKNER